MPREKQARRSEAWGVGRGGTGGGPLSLHYSKAKYIPMLHSAILAMRRTGAESEESTALCGVRGGVNVRSECVRGGESNLKPERHEGCGD